LDTPSYIKPTKLQIMIQLTLDVDKRRCSAPWPRGTRNEKLIYKIHFWSNRGAIKNVTPQSVNTVTKLNKYKSYVISFPLPSRSVSRIHF